MDRVDFYQFQDICRGTRLYGAVPSDVADGLIDDIYIAYTRGEIPCTDGFYMMKVMVRRFEDRCRNWLVGKRVTCKYIDESFKKGEVDVVSMDVVKDIDVEDIEYAEDDECGIDSLAVAISRLSAQQSRHYNNISKELLGYCNSDVQMKFLEAQARAIVLRKKNKKH